MQYSEQSLKEAINRINPVYGNLFNEPGIFLPRICIIVASDCWVEQKPENDDTSLVRQAIQDLNRNGCFNFQ